MKNKPPYAIGSVDHALHLAQLLQQEGPLRVTDAADRLEVSRSTAHRLLAMLVYRDFAEQIDDRRYRAGPVLRPSEASEAPVALLRRVAQPHLRTLVDRVDETANLMVLAGAEVRFVSTVECGDRILRVGDRAGRALPAHLVSGGKVLLAGLEAEELDRQLEAADASVDPEQLRRELALVRKRGFAVNDGLTEAGLTAVGMAVRDRGGRPVAAVSVAAPTVRFDQQVLPVWVAAVSAAVTAIGRELTAADG